eukprot:TCONS_00034192-protein
MSKLKSSKTEESKHKFAKPNEEAVPPTSDVQTTMKGYVFDLSPLRTSKNGKQYFKMSLEFEDGKTEKAICYSYKKRRLFEEAERNVIGVTISNHNRYPS